MTKKSKHASTPIENVNDHDISESQKKHFSKFGYKPYLSYKGKIKWLSFEQHVYEKIKFTHKNKNLPSKVYKPKRHRKSRPLKTLIKFIYGNYVLIIILLILLAFLYSYNAIIAFISNIRF